MNPEVEAMISDHEAIIKEVASSVWSELREPMFYACGSFDAYIGPALCLLKIMIGPKPSYMIDDGEIMISIFEHGGGYANYKFTYILSDPSSITKAKHRLKKTIEDLAYEC
jgi:hypothetical protein